MSRFFEACCLLDVIVDERDTLGFEDVLGEFSRKWRWPLQPYPSRQIARMLSALGFRRVRGVLIR